MKSQSLAYGRGMGHGHGLPAPERPSLDWPGIIPVVRLGPMDRSAKKAKDKDKYLKVLMARALLLGRCARHVPFSSREAPTESLDMLHEA